jgi:hypothetical protein
MDPLVLIVDPLITRPPLWLVAVWVLLLAGLVWHILRQAAKDEAAAAAEGDTAGAGDQA